ncbi:unnamed protein product [Cuscuta campestris]|uniref:Protein kinase domain-containing protein n=1 Tax=Cuscuta campestris TaxID=132261 RepID=A0A484MGE4_9ASTE|nr:unnamed protein product [Cuscuta campestris]
MEDHTITGGGEMPIKEREESNQKDEFLEKLDDLRSISLLFYRENYPLALALGPHGIDKEMEWLFSWTAELPLEGIDLSPGVKHFNFTELAPLTHHIGDDYVLGKTAFGRFIHAEGFFIKTWDLLYPIRHIIDLHPQRLRNEIMILTGMKHECLPKLRGYSIDKQFALVYQQEPSWTLQDILSRPDLTLTWDARMEVAAQIASLMEYFHSMGKTLGSIDPQNILVDKDINIKLCEFGLCGTIDAVRTRYENYPVSPHDALWLTGGMYSFQVPELMLYQARNPKEAVEWTSKCDIYCFGCLLLELISKEHEHSVESRYDDLKDWATQQLANKCEKNLVDKCLAEDSNVGVKATRM